VPVYKIMPTAKTWIFIGIAVIAIAIGIGFLASMTSRPPETSISGEDPLPVVLIHGLGADASSWNVWERLLRDDGIEFHTITFQDSDDKCGTSFEHAAELDRKIREIVSSSTDYDQVNIVGHSKGGLDARVYLANGTKDVANLIMIGTPNAGSPMAERFNVCTPGVWDALPESNATRAEMNPNTKYWTIAGDWEPDSQGDPTIAGPDDGYVQVSSVESEGYFQSLGRTDNRHELLLGEDEYKMALDVLTGRKQ
jgi:uncharacterized alpha/beta hydrolase family protein